MEKSSSNLEEKAIINAEIDEHTKYKYYDNLDEENVDVDDDVDEIKKKICKLNEGNSTKIYELDEIINDNLIILKEQKYCLSIPFGFVTKYETSNTKYYFADKNCRIISQGYSSISKLEDDDIHYIVSEFDYHLDFGYWQEQYGNEFTKNEYTRFKFHYGVVSVVDNNINQIVPCIYHDMQLTNNQVLFVMCDRRQELLRGPDGNYYVQHIEPKIGAINLDQNSKQYGMNIVPTIFDHITDFDLEYEGYAYAEIDDVSGYISKHIDTERYQNFLKVYAAYNVNRTINYSDYRKYTKKAVSEILYTKEEIVEFINNKNVSFIEKNSSDSFNNNLEKNAVKKIKK